ncbi:NAD(P)-dependent dehydrogenase, short-chain alcohol dehydrogenase family [Arachidicoccus rhizosphaerae]|uniref:NAD(P)-dependent dehydrogenase, short-chain alcohol dehydrogenase family n=1 Tax=Arachidicoccus rhizosphaerae TaxID=551991 RepID=A0A1H4B3Z8_9BACT|nr:SDR family oxidoreductase [Arachidicoccus rhizosphaerae]SEA42796.1 NAD(P)-dependent dehydrogenase, short-chain alcohol dehydrogenase family [Arachidicoccus rhizosphaerae]
MKIFENKVALVTGANSGIGYAAAGQLVSEGATVIMTGRRAEAIREAAQKIGGVAMVADQAKLPDTDRLFEDVKSRYGQLDILFVNAGITGKQAFIEQASEENFDAVMNINFKGAYFMLSRFIPLLASGASVVILSSIAASTHMARSSVYQASKAALNSMAKTAAAELADRKIRVNLVSPGPHKTEVLKKTGLNEQELYQINQHLTSIIPLKQMGNPADVAKLVSYLSRPESAFITGAEVIVDGGMTL